MEQRGFSCRCEIECIAIDARHPRDPPALSPLVGRGRSVGRSCSPTDDDKFVDNIDSDTVDKIRPAGLSGWDKFF